MTQQAHSTATQQEPLDLEDLDEILSGLRQRPRRLPCKYLYDAQGSQLFEQICELEEYYPTRTELGIMDQFVGEMAAALGPDCALIELGSGSGIKTTLLLEELAQLRAYVPVDIAGQQLDDTAARLRRKHRGLAVHPVCADFTAPFHLPPETESARRRAIYFPGSTIGNFARHEAVALLQQMSEIAGRRGGLLIGLDLVKSVPVLEAAYNDRQGVTAEFNLNLLHRINREWGGDFDTDQFQHRAEYNGEEQRIEMYLISQVRQTVTIGRQQFHFAAGDRICTEHSHKYQIDSFAALAAKAGWQLRKHWQDSQAHFAVAYLEVA